MGHISRDCRQPRRRRDTQVRTTEAATEAPQTKEEKAAEWLRGVAGDDEEVKDLVLQQLMGQDFGNA